MPTNLLGKTNGRQIIYGNIIFLQVIFIVLYINTPTDGSFIVLPVFPMDSFTMPYKLVSQVITQVVFILEGWSDFAPLII
jgi:hypothetical protein